VKAALASWRGHLRTRSAEEVVMARAARLRAKRFLTPALRGERIAAIGVSEPGAGSDVAAIRTTARRVGGDYGVNGSKTRVAFGKPLIKREVWQHRLVDLYTAVEAARQLAYHAVDCYNDERYVRNTGQLSFDTVKKVSMAKLYVADVADRVMDECLQLHGGMGYIEETFIARAWRDQRLLRIGGGTSEVMKYAIAKILGF
jgi:alkylation response protein AidB-like acyl-CoA dehydrogenase